MLKITLQVNLKFSLHKICAMGYVSSSEGDSTTALFYARNIPHLLKKIKDVYDISKENVVLTFQSE